MFVSFCFFDFVVPLCFCISPKLVIVKFVIHERARPGERFQKKRILLHLTKMHSKKHSEIFQRMTSLLKCCANSMIQSNMMFHGHARQLKTFPKSLPTSYITVQDRILYQISCVPALRAKKSINDASPNTCERKCRAAIFPKTCFLKMREWTPVGCFDSTPSWLSRFKTRQLFRFHVRSSD